MLSISILIPSRWSIIMVDKYYLRNQHLSTLDNYQQNDQELH